MQITTGGLVTQSLKLKVFVMGGYDKYRRTDHTEFKFGSV